jgi:hypothetical protein
MRRAKPHELSDHAVPVMTARISEAELAKWFPIQFDEICDPLQVPEPSRGALIKLDAGAYVVLNYGKDSGQLTVELPESTKDYTALIAAFFKEVPLPTSRVLWHRTDARLPKRAAAASSRQAKTSRTNKSVGAAASRQRTKRSAFQAGLPKKKN